MIGLIELLTPRRFADFWVKRCCANPEEVELRPWVYSLIRVEGALILGYVLWQSKAEDGFDEVVSTDWTEEEPAVDDEASVGIESPDTEVDAVSEEEEETVVETEPKSSFQPETTRFDLAAVLYHAEDPLTVSEIVDLLEGSEWEVGRSTTSATLYRLYNDGLVDREQPEDGRGYEYWLTGAGEADLEATDAQIEPDPFTEE